MPSKSSRRKSSPGKSIRALNIISESDANLSTIKDAVGLLRKEISPIKVSIKKHFFSPSSGELDQMAADFVALRLTDPAKRDARAVDSFALRDFEKKILCGISRARGVPYEGTGLMKLYQKLPVDSCGQPSESCVVVTDRLIMTWSEDDLRYHARVGVFGFPCVISISGLVEAPARPREYYLAKQALGIRGIGASEQTLAEQFGGRYLEPDDERTKQVLRGYILQCLFYSYNLEPFCKNKNCMLFNAHWQEEMLHAQVESGKLCAKHQKLLLKIISGELADWIRSP